MVSNPMDVDLSWENYTLKEAALRKTPLSIWAIGPAQPYMPVSLGYK